jgi:hypothetical protein
VRGYPGLELDGVRACIAYAHAVVANDSLDAVDLRGREIPGRSLRRSSSRRVAAR